MTVLFNIHSVAKHQKIEVGKNFYFPKKISVPKKTERGDPLGFSNIHSVAKLQNIEKDPLENFFSNKVSHCRKKTERGDPLVSPGDSGRFSKNMAADVSAKKICRNVSYMWGISRVCTLAGGRKYVEGTGSKIRVSPQVDIPNF